MNISIIGTGYVGVVTGVCFAKLGNIVTFVDIDKEKITKITQGISPIYEKNLSELITQHRERLRATTNYDSAIQNTTITFICVGTPSKKDGSLDLSYICDATRAIARVLKRKPLWHLVVVKSTVLPGTTQDVVVRLLEAESGKTAGRDFGIAVNPEFLKEGVAVSDFLSPDRIVIGYNDEKSRKMLHELYSGLSCPFIETSLSGAEMIKYASNAFLATKISFINEIGNMCKRLGIDTYEVANGVGLDKRISRAFLDSGIGWGGSCFPKDINALIHWSKKIGENASILSSVREVNDHQPLRLLTVLKKHVPKLRGKTIGILGLAFKPDTDDIRESRAIPLVDELLRHHAQIKAYDPQAMENFKKLYPNLEYCTTAEEVLSSDAILIVTAWDEFKKLDYRGKIVIDGRRLNEAKTAKIYEGVCW